MKTQTDYAKLINENKDNPGALADILIDIGARVSYLSDIYVELELSRAEYWQQNKFENIDNPDDDVEYAPRKKVRVVSDPKLKMMWMLTGAGEQWFRTKEDLKSCENARRTISQALKVKTNEAYNQY